MYVYLQELSHQLLGRVVDFLVLRRSVTHFYDTDSRVPKVDQFFLNLQHYLKRISILVTVLFTVFIWQTFHSFKSTVIFNKHHLIGYSSPNELKFDGFLVILVVFTVSTIINQPMSFYFHLINVQKKNYDKNIDLSFRWIFGFTTSEPIKVG